MRRGYAIVVLCDNLPDPLRVPRRSGGARTVGSNMSMNPSKFTPRAPSANSLVCYNVFGHLVPGVIAQCVCRSLQSVPGGGGGWYNLFWLPNAFFEVPISCRDFCYVLEYSDCVHAILAWSFTSFEAFIGCPLRVSESLKWIQ